MAGSPAAARINIEGPNARVDRWGVWLRAIVARRRLKIACQAGRTPALYEHGQLLFSRGMGATAPRRAARVCAGTCSVA